MFFAFAAVWCDARRLLIGFRAWYSIVIEWLFIVCIILLLIILEFLRFFYEFLQYFLHIFSLLGGLFFWVDNSVASEAFVVSIRQESRMLSTLILLWILSLCRCIHRTFSSLIILKHWLSGWSGRAKTLCLWKLSLSRNLSRIIYWGLFCTQRRHQTLMCIWLTGSWNELIFINVEKMIMFKVDAKLLIYCIVITIFYMDRTTLVLRIARILLPQRICVFVTFERYGSLVEPWIVCDFGAGCFGGTFVVDFMLSD